MKFQRIAASAAIASLALAAAPGAGAITINLTNGGGAGPGTAAFIGFSAAAHFWESVLTDNVTVNVRMLFNDTLPSNVLGSTSSAATDVGQASWRDALIADASTPLDMTATTHLASFESSKVYLNTSVQKALGLFNTTATGLDAIIAFNSTFSFDFDTRDGFAEVAPDFIAVAVHEMGHVLGFHSGVHRSTENDSRPANADMFRYKKGAFDITWGGTPYFSIDGGATQVFGRSGFANGSDDHQPSHWKDSASTRESGSCTVVVEAQIGIMDPTGGACQEGIVTAQDLALFDAIGWDLNMDILANPDYQKFTSQILQDYLDVTAVPEPGSWAMLAAGLGFAGMALRRRRGADRD